MLLLSCCAAVSADGQSCSVVEHRAAAAEVPGRALLLLLFAGSTKLAADGCSVSNTHTRTHTRHKKKLKSKVCGLTHHDITRWSQKQSTITHVTSSCHSGNKDQF